MSSLAIRNQLGKISARIVVHMQEAQNMLARGDLAVVNLPDLAKIAEFLAREGTKMQAQIDKWTDLMGKLAGDVLEAEEDMFSRFRTAGNLEPTETLERAENLKDQLEIKIDEIKLIRDAARTAHAATGGPTAPGAVPVVRLPDLKLPEFGGNVSEWDTFWESFRLAIDTNTALTGSQKATYLMGCLKGPAKAMLDGFTLTDANYTVMKDLLKNRYGDVEKRKNELQSELFRLPRADNTYPALRNLSEGIEKICRQLESLGVNVDNPFITTAIKEKIPPEVGAFLADKEIESGGTWAPNDWRTGLARAVKVKEAAGSQIKSHHSKPPNPGAKPQGNPTYRAFAVINQNNLKEICSLCEKKGHRPRNCPIYDTVKKRVNRLIAQRRCLKCAKEGHRASECPSGKNCARCGGPHHFIICRKEDNPRQSRPGQFSGGNTQPMGKGAGNPPQWKPFGQSNPFGQNPPKTQMALGTTTQNAVALPIIIPPENSPGELMVRPIRARGNVCPNECPIVFYDPGCQLGFITFDWAKKLKAKKISEEEISVGGFKGKRSHMKSPLYVVDLWNENGTWETFYLNGTDKIAEAFEYMYDDGGPIIRKSEPNICIGTKNFWKLFLAREEVSPGLFKIHTIFGTVYAGKKGIQIPRQPIIACPAMKMKDDPEGIESAVRNLWSLEAIGIEDSPEREEEKLAMDQFMATINREPNGRYSVGWPWKVPRPNLPTNYELAFSRFQGLMKKFKTSPQLFEDYKKIIDEQIEMGIIEKAAKTGSEEHYLSHSPVITHKTRIVYHANAHLSNQPSLNDCLLKGPKMTADLIGVLLRLRASNFPILCDIAKAYLMIGLNPKDREYTKFFWSPDLVNIFIYRFARVAFGVSPSAFILNATLRFHLKKVAKLWPEIAEEMCRNLMVDNLLLECIKKEEAVPKAAKAKEILGQIQMKLREFVAPDPNVFIGFPEEELLGKEIPHVLGINWILSEDTLRIDFPKVEVHKKPTRRIVLSANASAYDPLGLISPALARSKMFFQNLWDKYASWDEPLNEEDTKEWAEIVKDWGEGSIFVPRLTKTDEAKLELHIFTDASPDFYSCAAYIKAENAEEVKVALIFAKSRLKPKKFTKVGDMTIPRLELMAILIGCRIKKFISDQLNRPIGNYFLWSDSQIALSWLKTESILPVFVQNRVREINTHENITFGYVRTHENPADFGTRSLTPKQLQKERIWWEGPEWLKSGEFPNEFPSYQPTAIQAVPAIIALKEPIPEALIDFSRFNSFAKLQRTVLLMLRYLSKILKNKWGEKNEHLIVSEEGPWTAEDKIKAKNWIIKKAQEEGNLPSLYPTFLDKDGILRLNTRMGRANASENFRHPILLPHSHIAELLILEAHKMHCGVDSTLTNFLINFWTPRARKYVKGILNKCPICRRDKGAKFKLPPMPDWPKERVVPSKKPFECTGLDYLGPTLYKTGEEPGKAWLIIFTCFTTRAIHLEVVESLNANDFLMAFRRFIARRGMPSKILSDHGSQLVLAREALLLSPNITMNWVFTPVMSPWAGGIYERLISLVKQCFRRAINRKMLTLSQLITFASEVEGILNERPITFVSDLEGGPIPLRPVDFLMPLAKFSIEPPIEEGEIYKPSTAENLAHHWIMTNKALKEFWALWEKDYLILLRERVEREHKGPRIQSAEIPKIGHIVLVQNELMPRNTWPLGKIIELMGPMGKTRAAKLLMGNGRIWERPINHLVPLEVPPESEEPIRDEPEPIEEEKREKMRLREKPKQTAKMKEYLPREGRKPVGNRQGPNLSSAFLLVIVTLICATQCMGNGITCNLRGVVVKPNNTVENVDLCCENICGSRPVKGTFFYPMPNENLINGFDCLGKFWADKNQSEVKISCPPVNGCDLIDCDLCWERVLNPKCSPITSAILIGIFLMTLCIKICCLCCIFTHCRKCIRNIKWLMSCCCRKAKKIKLKMKRKIESDEEELIEWPSKNKRSNSRFKPLTRLGFLALIFLFPTVQGTGVVSMSAKTEECTRNINGTECSVNMITTLNIAPGGQPIRLLIKDPTNNIMGTLTLTIEKYVMECLLHTIGALCSYSVETVAKIRCSGAGPCDLDKCGKWARNQSINDKDFAPYEKDYEGHNYCEEGTGFLWNGCLAPKACMFYRIYARELSKLAYKLLECPRWEYKIKAKVRLELANKEPIESIISLVPGMTYHWKKANLSLTPAPFDFAPAPIMYKKFLKGAGLAAVAPDGIPTDYICTMEGNVVTKCNLSPTVCHSCKIVERSEEVNCLCRELNMEEIMSNSQRKLPLNIGPMVMFMDGGPIDRVWASLPQAPLQIVAKIENLSLSVSYDLATCVITPINITGCVNCGTGGKLAYRCKASLGEPLAEIICKDGIAWSTPCSQEDTEKSESIRWASAEVDTECTAKCPGGSTPFNLRGSLTYLNMMERIEYKDGKSVQIEKGGGYSINFPTGFSLWDVLKILSWTQIAIVASIIFIGIIVLFLVIKLNPMFKAYKVLARSLA